MSKICANAASCPFSPEQTTVGCPCAELCPGFADAEQKLSYSTTVNYEFPTGSGDFDEYATKISSTGIEKYRTADVVARDCYDKILVENDIMREQLAAIEKKIGGSMNDVEPILRSSWVLNDDGSATCMNCRHTTKNAWDYDSWFNYCPVCGADMREVNKCE